MVGKIGVGIANQRIPFFNQPVEIAVRQPQNAAQHHHRQLLCNHINSIKSALGKGSIDNIACQGADHLFILGDGRARKGRVDQFAGHTMFRRIGFLKGAPRQIFLMRLVFDADALRR